MRLYTLALAASLCAGIFAGAAAAQDQPPADGGHGHGCMAGTFQELGLSDAQKTQLKALRESGQRGPERRAAMEKILNADQLAKLKAAHEKCRAEHGQSQ